MSSRIPFWNFQRTNKFLFKGLSVEVLMVLIAGLDSRLLTQYSLWLGSLVARLTFDVVVQDNVEFPVD